MLLEDLWQHRNWTPSPKSPIPPTLDDKAQAEQCLRDNAELSKLEGQTSTQRLAQLLPSWVNVHYSRLARQIGEP